jgi:hypothetical protein
MTTEPVPLVVTEIHDSVLRTVDRSGSDRSGVSGASFRPSDPQSDGCPATRRRRGQGSANGMCYFCWRPVGAAGCVGEGVVEELKRLPAVAGAELERLAPSHVVDHDPEVVVSDPAEQDVDTIGGAVGEFRRHLHSNVPVVGLGAHRRTSSERSSRCLGLRGGTVIPIGRRWRAAVAEAAHDVTSSAIAADLTPLGAESDPDANRAWGAQTRPPARIARFAAGSHLCTVSMWGPVWGGCQGGAVLFVRDSFVH